MYALDQAEELSLTGWIKNLADGRVEIVAEGEETDVEAFAEWCKTGPESADVAGVKVTYSDPTDEFDEFVIRYASK